MCACKNIFHVNICLHVKMYLHANTCAAPRTRHLWVSADAELCHEVRENSEKAHPVEKVCLYLHTRIYI